MDTIHEEIKRFEKLQQEIAILGIIGAQSLEQAQRIYDELEALNLNPKTGRPMLKLVKGGLYKN